MTEPPDFFEGFDDVHRGVVRESTLHATNDFCIWETVENPSLMWRLSCWMNGWLPGQWRLGQVNDRWRFFRV